MSGYALNKVHHDFTETFRDAQLGHITERILVVDHSLMLSDAISYFERDESISALAVEEWEKVVGVLNRDTALQKASSRIELLKGKTVHSYLSDDCLRFDASDFCEKAFYTVMAVEDRQIKNLIIYEGTHFLGVIPINHLVRHVTKIHQIAYEHAHEIQQFFLDKSAKKVPAIDFASHIQMAHQIGGDFFHVRALEDGRCLFACFDVANKDIAASLTTGLLSSFFSMYFALEKKVFSPQAMVSELNRILVEQTPADVFVVAVILSFDVKEKTCTVFNHGYSPLYVCSPKDAGTAKVSRINPNFMPLGINPDLELGTVPNKLAFVAHTKFFTYSDGLSDAVSIHGDRFGDVKIKDFVLANIKLKPEGFMKNLVEEFATHTRDAVQVDDFTAIMIEVLG
jgi:sigma-B regulation protein RsbU (phosphoserine phosphatase)